MVQAIKEHVVVKEGGLIEIRRPELPPGTAAEVIVMIEEAVEPPPSLASLIGTGRGLFGSPEEVDAYLREERDSWER